MTKHIIAIRAHHFLCMQGFQGYGYNKAFTDNFKEIIEHIKKEPEILIKIINECDIICSACPHNKNGICEKNENSGREIQNMDLKVLKKLGLESGTIMKAKDVFSLIDEKIKTAADARDICGKCAWQNKCLWHMNREQ